MAERIALVDYGAGNLRSVENALRAAGAVDVAVPLNDTPIYPAIVREVGNGGDQ